MLLSPALRHVVLDRAFATVSLVHETSSTTDASTYNIGSVILGEARPDRLTIVGVTCANSVAGAADCTAVTVGGVSAAEVISANNSSNDGVQSSLWAARVPTGTSVTVDVTFASVQARMAMSVWRAVNVLSTTATATQAVTSGAPLSGSIAIPAQGFAVGVALSHSASVTSTWTGLTETGTEQFAEALSHSSGLLNSAALLHSQSVTCTWSTSNIPCMALAAFR